MSVERPSLWRVLSDTSRVISSNSLHFVALSLLFIFPITLLNIIHTLLLPPSPSPFSHYRRRLLSTVSNHDSHSQIPSFDKSLILTPLLYGLVELFFNLCASSSITTSIFHGLHSKPLKLAASLKSILSSFLPLLATKIVYLIIMAAIVFGSGICMGVVFFGLALLRPDIEPSSKPFMAVVLVTAILLIALFFYLGVKWCLMDAVVVVESKYGFAPFQRSSSLVRGTKIVAFLMIALFAILQEILSALAGGVVEQMVVYAGLSTVLSLFRFAANTVLFVHCKEFNGESEELEFQSDQNKLGQLYVQVPHDVDEV